MAEFGYMGSHTYNTIGDTLYPFRIHFVYIFWFVHIMRVPTWNGDIVDKRCFLDVSNFSDDDLDTETQDTEEHPLLVVFSIEYVKSSFEFEQSDLLQRRAGKCDWGNSATLLLYTLGGIFMAGIMWWFSANPPYLSPPLISPSNILLAW